MDNVTELRCTMVPEIDFDRQILTITEQMKNPFNEVVGNYWKTVVDTKEKMIRDGLIALGWTPPED